MLWSLAKSEDLKISESTQDAEFVCGAVQINTNVILLGTRSRADADDALGASRDADRRGKRSGSSGRSAGVGSLVSHRFPVFRLRTNTSVSAASITRPHSAPQAISDVSVMACILHRALRIRSFLECRFRILYKEGSQRSVQL